MLAALTSHFTTMYPAQGIQVAWFLDNCTGTTIEWLFLWLDFDEIKLINPCTHLTSAVHLLNNNYYAGLL